MGYIVLIFGGRVYFLISKLDQPNLLSFFFPGGTNTTIPKRQKRSKVSLVKKTKPTSNKDIKNNVDDGN
jgi:hypothetical protein